MKKHIIAIVGIVVALIMIFTACTAGNGEESANGTTAPSETVSTVLTEENTTEVTTESTTETTIGTTEQTSKVQTTEKKTEPKQTTTKKVQSTQKQTTTKKAVTTTAKVTTTQKNVSAKDVQAKVNAYIKSKGVKVDSSMTPSNASWRTQTAREQQDLNNGYTLRECKDWVDYHLDEYGKMQAMYCYYDNDSFYVLYWPSFE